MDDEKRRRLLKQYAGLREEARQVYGHDPLAHLDDAIDFPAEMARLKAKYCTPEYQAEAADFRRSEAARLDREVKRSYERQIERLSPFHVKAVKAGCDENLKPITTTEIQRMVMGTHIQDDGRCLDGWDRVESMFLLGQTLIGKTYAATWCAMSLAMSGCTVASVTALRVYNLPYEQLLGLRKVDLLILDQLHTLRAPSGKDAPAHQVGPVVDLIDYRYEAMATTIGAGTVDPDAMESILGADTKRRFPLRLSADSGDTRRE
jgi:hypothetical protein